MARYSANIEDHSDLLEHYLLVGHLMGYDPNPTFVTTYYISKYENELGDLNPLAHYFLKGRDLDYSTHPIHPLVCKNYDVLRLYFKQDDYFSPVEQGLPHIHEIHPLQHYLNQGYLEDRIISPLFDQEYYEETNPDSLNHYSCSFLHFINEGELLGYQPSPYFDFEYYDRQSKKTDLPRYHIRPFADFLLRGSSEFISPCALFDGEFYLSKNPDVAAIDMNPFFHYLRFGFSEQPTRDPHPLFSVDLYKNYAQLERHIEPIWHYLESKNDDLTITGFAFDEGSWYRDQMLISN